MIKNLENQDEIIKLIDREYTIPEEFKSIAKKAIKEFSTKNLKEETLDRLVNKPQSLRDNIGALGKNFANFKGYVAEWLVCMEYNSVKNKDSNVVFSMLNPDHQSKADIIHIIKVGNGYICKAGPDVKASENPVYILNSMERNYNERENVPILDINNTMTTEEARKRNLKPKQLERLNRLEAEFPKKKLIPSSISKEDVRIIALNYIKYIEYGVLPSQNSEKNFDVNKMKNPEYIKALKNISQEKTLKLANWNEYCLVDINTNEKINRKEILEDKKKAKNDINFDNNEPGYKNNGKYKQNKKTKYERHIELDDDKIEKRIRTIFKIGKGVSCIYKIYKQFRTVSKEECTVESEINYLEIDEGLDDSVRQSRCEHEVIEHTRRYKSGKVVNVRAHKRCVNKDI